MANKLKRRKKCLCRCAYRSTRLRCPGCGHRLTADRTSHRAAQMDNQAAIVKERDALRRLVVELLPVRA